MAVIVTVRVVLGRMRCGGIKILEDLGAGLVVVVDHDRLPVVVIVAMTMSVVVGMIVMMVVMPTFDVDLVASATAYLAHYSTSMFLIFSSLPVSRRSSIPPQSGQLK